MLSTKRKWTFFLLVICSVCGVIFISYNDSRNVAIVASRFACNMRELDPWDLDFPPAFESYKIINCSPETPLFKVNESGYLLFDQMEKMRMEAAGLTKIKCFYSTITRENTSDSSLKLGAKNKFNPPIFINSRVFLVTCMTKTTEPWYKQVHYNVAYNETSREKLQPESVDTPSIIILGFDSLSRSHAIRSLPKTMSYLTSVLGFYDFKGYTKCGENTFPNLLAMIAGVDWREFFGSSKMEEFLDDLPMFWKNINNHVSMYCEDTPSISTFNYLKRGFQNPPTDYYCRPLFVAYKRYPPFSNGNSIDSQHCYGNKLFYEIQLSYTQRFIAKYANLRKTVFLWQNDLLHDSFYLPGNSDIHLFNFLRWLNNEGHLKNSILIITSDHGFRLGGPSSLPLGRLEDTNPVFMLHLPKSFRDKYPWIQPILQHNADKLMSSHDIHATLIDIIHGKLAEKSGPQVSYERLQPRSLFQRIPQDRTCEEAGIPFQYCTRCFDLVNNGTKNHVAESLANFSIAYINKLLNKTSVCSKLYLKHVEKNMEIRQFNGGSKVTNSKLHIHVIMYKTNPNDGVFEHLLMRNEDELNNRSIIESMGSPLRLSVYGNQSKCTDELNLKPFCYCNG